MTPRQSEGSPINLLCVSTLEPRKNHQRLIAGFLAVKDRNPQIQAHLHLAGDRYTGAPEVEALVKGFAARENSIHWHMNPSWEDLRHLYTRCDFTIYPSFLEGFGLPIMESLWFARPCICANFGVMQDNALGGGCYTVDVTDEVALAAAIERVSLNADLRFQLAAQAISRPLQTWRDYAATVLSILSSSR
jgi:glycosyltransferase involved in cell wall biosynthesis